MSLTERIVGKIWSLKHKNVSSENLLVRGFIYGIDDHQVISPDNRLTTPWIFKPMPWEGKRTLEDEGQADESR